MPDLKLGSESIPAGRIFCVGKNYRKHIQELNDPEPDGPVIFMKPNTCLIPPDGRIKLPTHGSRLQHEVEVVVLIGQRGKNIPESEAERHISGITLGLDLTLRDVQTGLKKQGLPWELSKAFDGSSPLGIFVPFNEVNDSLNLSFRCVVNGEERQRGTVREMIYPVPKIISFISGVWELLPGDLIYTGTPSGVGPLQSGDAIDIESETIGRFSWQVD